jgi:hypothetical protein
MAPQKNIVTIAVRIAVVVGFILIYFFFLYFS